MIARIAITNDASRSILDYDAFVIYADLPTSLQCLTYACGISSRGFSSQLKQAAVRDWIFKSKTMWIADALRSRVGKPIFLLSRDVYLTDTHGSPVEIELGEALLRASIAPAHYIALPEILFARDGAGLTAYHAQSVDVSGTHPNQTKWPDHDLDHYNITGADIILRRILQQLDKHFKVTD